MENKQKKIKVELFALCQGAFDNKGQLTVVNTIDDFYVESFPTRLSFGLALKLFIFADEEGEKVLSILIINKEKKSQILPAITAKLFISKKNKHSHINIAVNLQNVLFETEGVYDVHLEIDGERLDDFAFEISKNV